MKSISKKIPDLYITSGRICTFLASNITLIQNIQQSFLDKSDCYINCYINNRSIREISQICIIDDDNKTFGNMTVLENIIVASTARYTRREKISAKLISLIEKHNLGISIHANISTLSKEDRKVVEILRAIIFRPKVLVINHLLGHFSPINIPVVKQLLNELKRKNCSIIYLTSMWEETLKISDEIYVYRGYQGLYYMSIVQALENPQKIYSAMMAKEISETKSDSQLHDSAILNIYDIGVKYILNEYSQDTALNQINQAVESRFGNVSSSIYIKSNGANSYTRVSNHNTLSSLSTDILDQIADENEIYITSCRENAQLLEMDISTLTAFPMQVGDKSSAILEIAFQQFHVVSDVDLQYIRLLTREITVIIQNTQLFSQSTLLQESHHRIKNNLQLIISLMHLQKKNLLRDINTLNTQTINSAFTQLEHRTMSIATVHDLLCQNRGSGQVLNLGDVIDRICDIYREHAQINIEIDHIINISHAKSSSIALILNELISNSTKHSMAFELIISIIIQSTDQHITLKYKDNGVGIQNIQSDNQPEKGRGLGTYLIRSIVKNELNGTIDEYNNKGACCTIAFEKNELL